MDPMGYRVTELEEITSYALHKNGDMHVRICMFDSKINKSSPRYWSDSEKIVPQFHFPLLSSVWEEKKGVSQFQC